MKINAYHWALWVNPRSIHSFDILSKSNFTEDIGNDENDAIAIFFMLLVVTSILISLGMEIHMAVEISVTKLMILKKWKFLVLNNPEP